MDATIKQFRAKHRYARLTARKARLIADMIRGRSANHALELLEFAPQRAATFYKKVLQSAVASAAQDADVNLNRLVVDDARADDGPMLQNRLRWRPGPQGRAMPFAKKTSHLTVVVAAPPDEQGPAAAGSKRKTASTPARTKTAEPESPDAEGQES